MGGAGDGAVILTALTPGLMWLMCLSVTWHLMGGGVLDYLFLLLFPFVHKEMKGSCLPCSAVL